METLCLLNLLAIHPWAEMETKNKTNTVFQLSKQSLFIRVIMLYFIISLAQSLEPKQLAPETFQHTSPIRLQASCNSFNQTFRSYTVRDTTIPGFTV